MKKKLYCGGCKYFHVLCGADEMGGPDADCLKHIDRKYIKDCGKEDFFYKSAYGDSNACNDFRKRIFLIDWFVNIFARSFKYVR